MKRRWRSPNAAMVFALLPSIIAAMFVATPARGDPNETAWLAARPVRHEPIEWGNEGPFRVPLVKLLTSEAQWKSTMDSLERCGDLTVLPAPDPPRLVDWRHDAVVLVAMGEFRELHCFAKIREVRRIGHQVLCDVQIDVLPPPRIQVFTAPYYVIKIARRGDKESVAARYEFRLLGSPTEASRVTYSNSDAFLKTGALEPAGEVSWGALKGSFR